MSISVFIVEDDKDIVQILKHNFEKEGFFVKSYESGVDLLIDIKKEKPDIFILDVMLPDIEGFSLLKLLKADKDTENIPILMLTAKSGELDKLQGLELGADDYITKPFSIRELIVRIKNILKRYKKVSSEKNTDTIQVGDIKVYLDSHRIVLRNDTLNLTPSEFRILLHFLKYPNRIFPREYILKDILNSDINLQSRVVDVHIKNIRDKLKDYGKYLKTVRGIGYKFEFEE